MGHDGNSDEPLLPKTNQEIRLPTLYMMVGLPGSGKSYWVNEKSDYVDTENAYRYSTDEVIDNVAAEYDCTYDQVWSKLIDFATYVSNRECVDAIENECDIYWDQTNLSKESRRRKLQRFAGKGYRKIAVVCEAPTKEEWEVRLEREGKTIPDDVMNKMIDSFEMPTLDEGFDEIIRLKDLHEEDAIE